MTTISCIVPVYNGARFVAEALDSILAQSLPPTEIIVVDDGSTDATPAVVDRYARFVTYVRQDNRGPGAARNHGIALAHGDLLSFLDADDLWHVSKLERQLHALESNPTAAYCITQFRNVWLDEVADERDLLHDHAYAQPLPGYICQCLLGRRATFDVVGKFDEEKRFGEDIDWYARADQAGMVKVVVDEPLVQRRLHGRNSSYAIYRSEAARADMLLDLATKNLKRHRRRGVD